MKDFDKKTQEFVEERGDLQQIHTICAKEGTEGTALSPGGMTGALSRRKPEKTGSRFRLPGFLFFLSGGGNVLLFFASEINGFRQLIMDLLRVDLKKVFLVDIETGILARLDGADPVVQFQHDSVIDRISTDHLCH